MTDKLSKAERREIFDRLFTEAKKKGFKSQAALGRWFKVEPQSVQQWKNGESLPDRNLLYKFCTDNKISFHLVMTGERATESQSDNGSSPAILMYAEIQLDALREILGDEATWRFLTNYLLKFETRNTNEQRRSNGG